MLLLGFGVNAWHNENLGNLHYADTMRMVIGCSVRVALGFRQFFRAFLLTFFYERK